MGGSVCRQRSAELGLQDLGYRTVSADAGWDGGEPCRHDDCPQHHCGYPQGRRGRHLATAGCRVKRGVCGYGVQAAVIATPATRYDRPFRVIRSPALMPSASAKLRSTTTPPLRTQRPWVSFGWSTEAGPPSRPSATTPTVTPCTRRTARMAGKGPLWPVTPGAWSSALTAVIWSCVKRPAAGGGKRRATQPAACPSFPSCQDAR